jgi:release factor glutamine methyltransferase
LKIKEALLEGKKLLEEVSDAPMLDAEVLLSYLLGINRAALIAKFDEEIDASLKEKFISLISKRVSGIPLYYIIGEKEFMGLEFYINENVLIPRQETETLVEEALKAANNKTVSVLDVGTGSGCILLSFLYYNKSAKGTGIDISGKALEVAKENAKRLHLEKRARFLNADLRTFKTEKQYDIVLSNPPYVRIDEMASLRNEPEVALLGGKDGVDIYPALGNLLIRVLKKGGIFIVEIDYRNSMQVENIFETAGLKVTGFVNDLTNRKRFIKGTR